MKGIILRKNDGVLDVVYYVFAQNLVGHGLYHGVVVFSGVSVASVLTLFVVPSLYSLLAKYTTSPLVISKALEKELARIENKQH